jgi:hypothetical protein
VTVLFVSNVLWSIWGRQEGVKRWIVHLLPPVHRTDELYRIVGASDASVPWSLIAWLGGYGLGAFLLGLVVLRRRSMATS